MLIQFLSPFQRGSVHAKPTESRECHHESSLLQRHSEICPLSVLSSDHQLAFTPTEAANQSRERQTEHEPPEPAELTHAPVAAILPFLILQLQL